MAHLLGIDTGGTYTDAVILDDSTRTIVATAKALTTRHDLAVGVGGAAEKVMRDSGIAPSAIGLVSISTTLATNALVEGQGGRVALVMIGFEPGDLAKADLNSALGADPAILIPGGHDVHGRPRPLDTGPLEDQLDQLAATVTAFAVAGYFAVRNPEHEIAVRDLVRARTGLPVTCSHELSAKLNGPRRALTTVLNARLVGMIDRLIAATEGWMSRAGIAAPLMVVRGDGALVAADFARARPIETILSGPAASLVGARFLTGADSAVVSDIGGTTTDIAVLDGGRPRIDPAGATVGGWRTMVDAVAMRTFGLGGDSEVAIEEGVLHPRILIGPRRLMPLALAAHTHGAAVLDALDRQMKSGLPGRLDGRFAVRTGVPDHLAAGLTRQESDLYSHIDSSPKPLDTLLKTTAQGATLARLVARGLVHVAGYTPSDAQHVVGSNGHWNRDAAQMGAALFARRKDGRGDPVSRSAEEISARVIARVERLSAERILETVLAEDGLDGPALVASPLVQRFLDKTAGIAASSIRMDRPVIGLGAGAPVWYPPAGALLGAETIVPEHAGVANAVGAVAGQVRIEVSAEVMQPEPGRFRLLSAEGPRDFSTEEAALSHAESGMRMLALARAAEAGADSPHVKVERFVETATVEDQRTFISGRVVAVATGRPRIAA